MKIMICEQDQEQIKLIKNVLNNYRFKHIIPKKGADVFELILNQKPSILIFNENFDRNIGINLISKLRKNPITENIPVIYISDKSNFRENFMDFSNDSFLQLMTEPFRIKFLRHYIDRWTTFRSLYIKH